jgi:hypothetical protein
VPASGSGFVETFDTPASLDRFDWYLHKTSSHQADHGAPDSACGHPDTSTRPVVGGDVRGDPVNDERYWCDPAGDPNVDGNHMMTSIDTGAVVDLNFSPKQVFTDVRKVCFETNHNNLEEGKWATFLIVHAERVADNVFNLATGSGPDLDPELERLAADEFGFFFFRGSGHAFNGSTRIHESWGATEANFDPSAAPRYTFCVEEISPTRLRFTRYYVSSQSYVTFESSGVFPDGPVRVIFQDANYNPTKHGGSAPAHLTWHWDDIVVEVAP